MAQTILSSNNDLCSKPKNQRVKRALEDRAPKLVENSKKAMFIRGGKVSELVSQAMKELVSEAKCDYNCTNCNFPQIPIYMVIKMCNHKSQLSNF